MRLRLISLIPVVLVLFAFLCRNVVPERVYHARSADEVDVFRDTYGWPSVVLEKRPTVPADAWPAERPDGFVEAMDWVGLIGNVALVLGLALGAALVTSWLVCRRERRRGSQAAAPATSHFPCVGVIVAMLLFTALLAVNFFYEFVETNDQFSPLHNYGWPFVAVEEHYCMALSCARTWHHWAFAGDILVGISISLAGGVLCEALLRMLARLKMVYLSPSQGACHPDDKAPPAAGYGSFSLGSLLVAVLVTGLILWANLQPRQIMWRQHRINGDKRVDRMIDTAPIRLFGWPYWALRQESSFGIEQRWRLRWRSPDPWDWRRGAIIKDIAVGFAFVLAAAFLMEVLVRFGVFSGMRRLRWGTICGTSLMVAALLAANAMPLRVEDVRDLPEEYVQRTDSHGWPFEALRVRRNGTPTKLYWAGSGWRLWGLAGNLVVAAGLITIVGFACEYAPRMARGGRRELRPRSDP